MEYLNEFSGHWDILRSAPPTSVFVAIAQSGDCIAIGADSHIQLVNVLRPTHQFPPRNFRINQLLFLPNRVLEDSIHQNSDKKKLSIIMKQQFCPSAWFDHTCSPSYVGTVTEEFRHERSTDFQYLFPCFSAEYPQRPTHLAAHQLMRTSRGEFGRPRGSRLPQHPRLRERRLRSREGARDRPGRRTETPSRRTAAGSASSAGRDAQEEPVNVPAPSQRTFLAFLFDVSFLVIVAIAFVPAIKLCSDIHLWKKEINFDFR